VTAALTGVGAATGFMIHRQDQDKGILFHHRRQISDGQILLLVNTSIESSSSGTFESDLRGVEQWDPYTGGIQAYPFETVNGGIRAAFTLPPCGSLLVFLSNATTRPANAPALTTSTIAPVSQAAQIRRLGPNVLTLDYMDVTAGGQTRTNTYFYQANQFAFQRNGMDRNPWDSAVQFKDELITRTFSKDSGLTATYKFRIEDKVPAHLSLVVERPDLYAITCNGRPVSSRPGRWWLDRAFGRIDLGAAATLGENIVTLKASPFTIDHELEPVYVLGDFSLRPLPQGFAIDPDRPLSWGPWDQQGQPFYAEGVTYTQTYVLPRPRGRYAVGLAGWRGSVAQVSVNGRACGTIVSAPWQCDVTDRVRSGRNVIEVTVIGTLKNTLGPHHGKPGLGSAWPGMFQQGPQDGPPPGGDYATVGYGLFEPFVLRGSTEK
jgi:hypothetical protein